MDFGIITTEPCLNVVPPPDDRCSDPAFALANPDMCPVAPSLIIKPALALRCQLDSVQFRAFIVESGRETDVTDQSVFTSGNRNVAVIGVSSGNATGLTAGLAIVTATYNALSAKAEFNVLSCLGGNCGGQSICDATVAMQLLVDTSRSMSQAFGAGYNTKLDFAKAAASEFAGSINQVKDFIGLTTFNALGASEVDPPTHTAATVQADLLDVTQTQQLTTFRTGIESAIASLNGSGADIKVLVLISDGEDTTDTYDDENNPLIPIGDFKQAGGLVMCLGVRAHDRGFDLLEAFSTGGFFVNSYDGVEDAAILYLKGLKSYVCAGNCVPEGDEFLNCGELDFVGFTNWDVIGGHVDLIGNGFFDVLPGNGLYVDLAGTSPEYKGVMQSKVQYSLTAGSTYRFSVQLAGNQRVDSTPESAQVRIYTDSLTVLQQQIAIGDYRQGFQWYSFTFVADSDMDVWLSVEQLEVPANSEQLGLLLGTVQFENVTTGTLLLDDDFDDENPTYIPPRCGTGTTWVDLGGGIYGYAEGTNCYGEGCLDEPPGVQTGDPNPLSDIEAGFTPPKTYTSTRQVCTTCGNGRVNVEDVVIGQFLAATVDYRAILELDEPDTALSYTVPSYAYAETYVYPTSWRLEGSQDGTNWVVLDTRSNQFFSGEETKTYKISGTPSYKWFAVFVTASAGQGALMGIIRLYGLAQAAEQQKCATGTGQSTVSQADADAKADAAALAAANAQLRCATLYTATASYTAVCDYGLFPVTRSAVRTSVNSYAEALARATADAQAAAEAALNCAQSNNAQRIEILDPTGGSPKAASPYPSAKLVAAFAGSITNVTVQINGFTHPHPDDVHIILVAPDGTTCCLMRNCGGAVAVSAVDLVFDDAAGTPVPDETEITAGSYVPTQNGAEVNAPAPCGAGPYGATLSVFNGITGAAAAGHWMLFVFDDSPADAGSINGGWDLTITAA